MDTVAEYAALMDNRENLYRFLSFMYKAEVDQAQLAQLKAMKFPAECGKELSEGYRIVEEYLKHPGSDPLTDLAVEYARVFLGAGIVDSAAAAYPYESVYTSPKRLIMQDARDQVLAVYQAKGLNVDESLDLPEDHIAFEFEFMAYLCQETKAALAAKDDAKFSALLTDQMNFLTDHLLNWIPQFCADIGKFAETGFYRGVGKITSGYLQLEQLILADMIADTAA